MGFEMEDKMNSKRFRGEIVQGAFQALETPSKVKERYSVYILYRHMSL